MKEKMKKFFFYARLIAIGLITLTLKSIITATVVFLGFTLLALLINTVVPSVSLMGVGFDVMLRSPFVLAS